MINYRNSLKAKLEKAISLSTILPNLRERVSSLKKIMRSVIESRKRYSELIVLLGQTIVSEPIFSSEIYKEAKQNLKNLNSLESKLTKDLMDLFIGGEFWLEINPGVGGREALLFAEELTGKYSEILTKKSLNFKIISPVKLLIPFEAFVLLKFEQGVHRVQRIPTTEASGRMHTSTVSVNLVSSMRKIDVILNPSDIRMEAMRSTGPGGQHVNTTSSAIRVIHEPTGVFVKANTARNQLDNIASAKAILKEKLEEKARDLIEEISQEENRDSVSKDRSDKIRTYNFQSGRISDHRCSFKISSHIWKEPMQFLAMVEEIKSRME